MVRWPALSNQSRETFWRSLRTLTATRVVIAAVLLLYLAFNTTGPVGEQGATCLSYLLLAVVFAALAWRVRRRFLLQLIAQIALDIVVISILYMASGGLRSGLAILYLFPLAGAAILAPLMLAMFFASLVALFMLAETTYKVFMLDGEIPYLQAGLYGAAYFAAVVVVSRLADKLIGQEELAAARGVDLAVQQAVTHIVMADMGDGVLVAGRDGHVFSANPAARRMLGLGIAVDGFSLSQAGALAPLLEAFNAWLDEPDGRRVAFVHIRRGEAEGAGLTPGALRGMPAHLKLRFAHADTPEHAPQRCIVFMQDVTAIENQAQELKLASMGRLTASIAHEVRNPLSAIGHATALLAEDLNEKAHQRLLRIVGDNVARVNRMVEDILKLSRKVQPSSEPLLLAPFLTELCAELQENHGLAAGVLRLEAPPDAQVRFDPLHLREVALNLMNNAVRYASGKAGSIRVAVVMEKSGRMELHVQDDGPGISAEVRAHLFEPFYTTSSKGTGLGLYLARELCLNNRATLDYEYRLEGPAAGRHASGRFVITFAQALAV